MTTRITRTEHDLLGDKDVPADAYWGVHTARACENFPITGTPIAVYPHLVAALAAVKSAAARATLSSGCSRRRSPRRSARPAPRSAPGRCATSSSSTSSRAAPARRRT